MVSLSLKRYGRYVALCLTVFTLRDRLLIANNDQNDVIQNGYGRYGIAFVLT